MTVHTLTFHNNIILASLPREILSALQPCLSAVELEAEAVLYESGSPLGHVYFPSTAVISLFSPLQDGAGTEVAVVGPEGVAGVCAFMGSRRALSSAVVQRAGLAWRMSARDIADLARDSAPVMQQLLRYTQALFTQMAQTSSCHRHHALSQQLCRWLLLHLDRQTGDEMLVTQERIAGLLGVRREGVTGAAHKLQQEGLIHYRRGRIQVLDREGLEAHSCECYGIVDQAYKQLSHSGGQMAHATG